MSKKLIFLWCVAAGRSIADRGRVCVAYAQRLRKPPAQPTQAPAASRPKPPEPTDSAHPTEAPMVVPNMDEFKASGHADAKAEAFNHWNDANPPEVPTACATCHTSAGFHGIRWSDRQGRQRHSVPPSRHVQCETCHNVDRLEYGQRHLPVGQGYQHFRRRRSAVHDVPPGTRVQGQRRQADQRHLQGHRCRYSGLAPVVTNGVTSTFGFRNVHYFAAGATLYGSKAQGGYEYDGKIYDPKIRHVEGMDTCVACHDQHATQGSC